MSIVDRIAGDLSAEETSAALQDLAGVLPGHLASEERTDGLFDWLRALGPERRGEIEALRAEHADIRSRMAAARHAFDSGKTEAGQEQAVFLASALRSHEAVESKLVKEILAR